MEKLNLKTQKLNLKTRKLNFPGIHWRVLAVIGAQKKPLEILLEYGTSSFS